MGVGAAVPAPVAVGAAEVVGAADAAADAFGAAADADADAFGAADDAAAEAEPAGGALPPGWATAIAATNVIESAPTHWTSLFTAYLSSSKQDGVTFRRFAFGRGVLRAPGPETIRPGAVWILCDQEVYGAGYPGAMFAAGEHGAREVFRAAFRVANCHGSGTSRLRGGGQTPESDRVWSFRLGSAARCNGCRARWRRIVPKDQIVLPSSAYA